jgi:hypothetical protein
MEKKIWISPDINEVSLAVTLGGSIPGTTEDEINGIIGGSPI